VKPSEEFILDARGIHAWYGSSHVLHGVDLQIARGETIGLLGRNGMGKSTLIRTLLGHVAQRDGSIGFFGKDASRAKPHEVARLGVAYVPEGRGVFPNLSVRENLIMAARRGRDGRNDWSYERGLAPLIVLDIWNVIDAIRASGIATLIVDRDYRKVLQQSDRALVLQKGQVVLAGSADEVAGSEALAGYLGV